MHLSELMKVSATRSNAMSTLPNVYGGRDPNVVGIASDSRDVRPGYIFAALPGIDVDGINFVEEAVSRGAVAIITQNSSKCRKISPKTTIIETSNPRLELAKLAACFFHDQPDYIAAVTGTNGKTSVVDFVRQMWIALGYNAASLGTLGLKDRNALELSGLTTPDTVKLHKTLKSLCDSQVDYLALEASSHGLDQFRIDGVKISVAAFTNLTQDHLDYHKNMQTYFKAKVRLFSELLIETGTAVLNFDAPEFEMLEQICHARGIRVISFGSSNGADIQLLETKPFPSHQEIKIKIFNIEYQIELMLLGKFQIFNSLTALGIVLATQKENDVAFLVKELKNLTGVAGRLECVTARNSPTPIIVDYAHTPDALKNALLSLRAHVSNRIICVFGAGGERDKSKRQIMGQVAKEHADLCLITDDNPRSENPKIIRDQILDGCPKGISIEGRRNAIEFGISQLRDGDLLLIAGKGHETTQEINGQKINFNDVEVVQEILKSTEGFHHDK